MRVKTGRRRAAFTGIGAVLFLRCCRLVCRFTAGNARRSGVRFGICAVLMPAVFGVRLLVTVGYRNIMPYSRAGANKHYGFGALDKLQGSHIPIFVIDEWIALLL